jgi:CHASE2 domain-containing sensor protein
VSVTVANKRALLVSLAGAGMAVLCGLILWSSSLGDAWVNASYDILFRFGYRAKPRAETSQVTLILMDNTAFKQYQQIRPPGHHWDRALHTQLLNKLADDGCSLVVMDTFFEQLEDPKTDNRLAAAMHRQRKIVLMGLDSELEHSKFDGVQPEHPADVFLGAASNNWGVALLAADPDGVVRQQWPFPSPGIYPSLAWTAARLAGAKLSDEPQERYLRYYGQNGNWETMSYGYALDAPPNYFRNHIVFIGNDPATAINDGEKDKFATPYTAQSEKESGGVKIHVTAFLNLLNDESLLRPPAWTEFLTLTVTGLLLGGGLCRLRRRVAVPVALGVFLAASLAGICLSYYTNFWFPWLIIAGGQVPCSLAWTFVRRIRRLPAPVLVPGGPSEIELAPETPGYELVHPAFAEGAYGKVWLALSSAGTWRALKVIYQSKFGEDTAPYEREFNGVQKYQSIADKHPGLLRVDFVSKKKNGCFYYVMELGDALAPGWEHSPGEYKPRDLVSVRAPLRGRRLPVRECAQIGATLCHSLEFLHQHGMTHRDIKPQNIIFVNGQPKLADLGLISGIRPPGQEGTLVGTPGYMPPLPERPGTVAADIYALGMVIYVTSTGRQPGLFPEVATTLVSAEAPPDFWPLNGVILKACQPLPEDRYVSAAEMGSALEAALKTIKSLDTASH